MRVMVVFDYLRWSAQDAALVEIQSAFDARLLGPVRGLGGLASHFDGGADRLAGTKRVKRLRVDLRISSPRALRSSERPQAPVLSGTGPGRAGRSRPELALGRGAHAPSQEPAAEGGPRRWRGLGGTPRRVSSRAVCRTRTAPNPLGLTCAKRRSRRSGRLSSPCSVLGGPRRGPGSKKRDNPYGGTHGRSTGQYFRGRGTKGGAAAWLSAGVVASTYRGTGLVRGPVPLRLPPRPFGRAAPLRFAAVRGGHFGHVFEPVRAATSYTCAFARWVMNRIAHICTGNISAWAGVAAALAAPVLLSVQRGSVGVVDETLAAVAQPSAELVHAGGRRGRRGGRADRPGRRPGSQRLDALRRGDLVYRAGCPEPLGSRVKGELASRHLGGASR